MRCFQSLMRIWGWLNVCFLFFFRTFNVYTDFWWNSSLNDCTKSPVFSSPTKNILLGTKTVKSILFVPDFIYEAGPGHSGPVLSTSHRSIKRVGMFWIIIILSLFLLPQGTFCLVNPPCFGSLQFQTKNFILL